MRAKKGVEQYKCAKHRHQFQHPPPSRRSPAPLGSGWRSGCLGMRTNLAIGLKQVRGVPTFRNVRPPSQSSVEDRWSPEAELNQELALGRLWG